MKHLSKTCSYFLRHHPHKLGIELDSEGWTDISILLRKLKEKKNMDILLNELEQMVLENDKQRFSIKDGKIRANQGHSIKIDIKFEKRTPPAILWHGTTEERWEKIRKSKFILPMNRHHVHLSDSEKVAKNVAGRHRNEKPKVLKIDTKPMINNDFYISENGVWLVDKIPIEFVNWAHVLGIRKDVTRGPVNPMVNIATRKK